MAIRTFNSVGGFSVGELATTVIDSTGIGSFTSIKTDHLYYANGNAWDLQEAAGSNGFIQFNVSNNFAATANLTFVTSTDYANSLDAFRVIGNISSNNISASNSISAIGNITTNGNFSAQGNVSIGGNVSITGNMSVGTITGNLIGNVTGNFAGNATGNFAGNFSGNITGGATISAPGSDKEIIFNDGNTIEAASGFKYFKADSSVEVTGNIKVGAVAHIVGNATFDSTLDVTGAATLSSLSATTGLFSSTLGVTGAANLSSTLNVTGAANLSSTLGVTGAVSLANTLGVTGVSTLANAVITTDASVGNTLTTKNLTITGTVTGDLNPTVNYGGNLGNATHAWKDLWLSGSTINLGSQTLSSNVNGTTLSGITAMTTAVITGVNTTADASTGALVVAGGVGIGGNIYVTGTAKLEHDVLIGKSGAVANANVTGKLQVGGDAAITGNADITGNITITGDLTVGGNTTYVNTTNTSIKDAIIDLGGAGSGGDITGSATGDRGLLLHGSNSVNQFVGWSTGNSEFQMLTATTLPGGVATGSLATLRIDTLRGTHVYGTIETDTQPNVKVMLGLTDTNTGNANVTLGKIATLYASGLKYPTADGAIPASNEVTVLKTDGANTLGFSTIHTDRIANASSMVMVNIDGSTDVTANGVLSFSVIKTGAAVTGDLAVSGVVNVPAVNAPTVNTSKVSIGSTFIYSARLETTTTSATVIATVDSGTCRAVDFFVKGENTNGSKYTVATITAIYYGTNVDYTVHSKLSAGTGSAGSFTVVLSGTDIQLIATPTSTASTIWVTQIRTI